MGSVMVDGRIGMVAELVRRGGAASSHRRHTLGPRDVPADGLSGGAQHAATRIAGEMAGRGVTLPLAPERGEGEGQSSMTGQRLPVNECAKDAGQCLDTTTSPIRKKTCWECTTFAPILINFSREVVSDPRCTDFGGATRRREFPDLYAIGSNRRRAWLSRKSWQLRNRENQASQTRQNPHEEHRCRLRPPHPCPSPSVVSQKTFGYAVTPCHSTDIAWFSSGKTVLKG